MSELFTDDKPDPAVMVLRGNDRPTVDTDGLALPAAGRPQESRVCRWVLASNLRSRARSLRQRRTAQR
ncbi:hypothetical protein ACWDKQ_00435 [Saccharopolyspora sp. NPDC000995]